MKLKSLLFVVGLLGAGVGDGSCSTAAASTLSHTCVGDCGRNGQVTVDEILTMVNIALGTEDLATCELGDAGGDSRITVDEILMAVNNALRGCPSIGPTETPATPTPTPTRTPTMSSETELFDVGANFFSIRKPKGWEVHLGNGFCTTLGILIRDPAVPLRQIFYFGMIGPVYLTEQQKQLDQYYIDHGGWNFITWLDAPVVSPLTAENFFVHWPDIAHMRAATDFMSEFPKLTGLTAVSNTPQSPVIPGGNAALLRGLFMENGVVGEGQFLGTVWVFSPYTGVPGGGTGYGGMILGVTAPKAEFGDVEARLIASLDTFTVTQGYVDWCVTQLGQLWGAVAQEGQVLSETSDLIFEGWQNRSQASDIMAEKSSDAFRGVDRVYDPSTGQVYEVPVGWYTSYDAHRGEYTMSDLQLLPGNNYPLWMSAPAEGSGIH
jgi:hypothetical protein